MQTEFSTTKFDDLHHARDELWSLICRLESLTDPIRGNVDAAQAIVTSLRDDAPERPLRGLRYVLEAAEAALDELDAWSDRMGAAIKVVRQNNPKLLSEAAVMQRLNPDVDFEEAAR